MTKKQSNPEEFDTSDFDAIMARDITYFDALKRMPGNVASYMKTYAVPLLALAGVIGLGVAGNLQSKHSIANLFKSKPDASQEPSIGSYQTPKTPANHDMDLRVEMLMAFADEHMIDDTEPIGLEATLPKESGLLDAPAYAGPTRTNLTSGYHVGGRNVGIDQIFLHITQSEGKSAENSFHNHELPAKKSLSAHYIVENGTGEGKNSTIDGAIIQIVPETNIAYHCKGHNEGTLSIEMVGTLPTDPKTGYPDGSVVTLTDAQKTNVIALVTSLQRRYKISDDNVYGHRDFAAKECPGEENLRILKAELAKYKP